MGIPEALGVKFERDWAHHDSVVEDGEETYLAMVPLVAYEYESAEWPVEDCFFAGRSRRSTGSLRDWCSD